MLLGLSGLMFEAYPHGPRLIDYMAIPRIDHSSFRSDLCLDDLTRRKAWDLSSEIKFAPQDFRIFKRRYDLFHASDHCHHVAMEQRPTLDELISFSHQAHGWSTLFPLKIYLMHRPELAKAYCGLLPLGRVVIAFYRHSHFCSVPISTNPTYEDHVRLAEVSNKMAAHLGMTSVMVNNLMHLEGTRLRA